MENQPDTTKTKPWHWLSLAAILGLTIFLHFYRLEQEGYGNLYYAAAVKSMLASPHNFFFVSFDPGGFVSVDKPPLGLWVQAFSAMLFGFDGWSLHFPQALAGVLSVALLYHLVRRVFGPTAGVVAALVLAVTPITIAANRNNTMDSQLVFTSLLAAWAASLAAERGKLRWLLLCAFFVGVGFNIKMLQAVMVLPAFYLLYLMASPIAIWKRLIHLTLATILLVAVSLSWAVIVDMTPPEDRPFVGSSQDNTVMELILGHNGAARLGQIGQLIGLRSGPGPGNPPQGNPPSQGQPPSGQFGPPPGGPPPNQGPPPNAQGQLPITNNQTGPGGRGPNGETGEAGVLRLFNEQLGGQASWLLPLSALCLLAAAWQAKLRWPLAREHQALLLWSAWLAPQVVFFSYAGLFHRYYLEMLSPAIAALVGAGFAAMWQDYRDRNWRGWLLPVALLAGAATEAYILAAFPDWAKWLTPLVAGLSILTALALIVLRLTPNNQLSITNNQLRITSLASTLGLLALLIAPTLWSLTPLWAGGDVALPYAGPELLGRPQRPPQAVAATPQAGGGQEQLLSYLNENRNGEKFLVATLNANTAAPIILATGEPVMALGGFSGGDDILSSEALAAKVESGEVRFFLLPQQQQPGEQLNAPAPNRGGAAAQWVAQSCVAVPSSLWQSASPGNTPMNAGPGGGPLRLFDCGN
jgi:4-amino-4-deoxy-L-arabinose transferase-like glycosyltransferase